jgi:hypothetical protein
MQTISTTKAAKIFLPYIFGTRVEKPGRQGPVVKVIPDISDYGWFRQGLREIHSFQGPRISKEHPQRIDLAQATSLQGNDKGVFFLQDEGDNRVKGVLPDTFLLGSVHAKKNNERNKWRKILIGDLSKFAIKRISRNPNYDDAELMESAKKILNNQINSFLIGALLFKQRQKPLDKLDIPDFFDDTLFDRILSFQYARLIARSLMSKDQYYSLKILNPEYQDANSVINALVSLIKFGSELGKNLSLDIKDRYFDSNVMPFIDFLQKISFYLPSKQSQDLRETIYILLDEIDTRGLPVSNALKNNFLRMLVPVNLTSREVLKFRNSRPSINHMGLNRDSLKQKRETILELYQASDFFFLLNSPRYKKSS